MMRTLRRPTTGLELNPKTTPDQMEIMYVLYAL